MAIQRFLFDYDFELPGQDDVDAPPPPPVEELPPEPEEPPPPPPPTFTEEELQLAREQAFERGRDAGRQEAEMETGRMIASALEEVGRLLPEMIEQAEMNRVEAHRTAAQVVQAVLRKVLPQAVRLSAAEVIEDLVGECLGRVIDEPRVVVRVSDPMVDDYRDRLEERARLVGFEGRLVVVGDGRLGPADCKLEWADGGAERHANEIWKEIDAVIDRAINPDHGSDNDILE